MVFEKQLYANNKTMNFASYIYSHKINKMKKLFLFFSILISVLSAQAQIVKSCCAKPATEKFAGFASDNNFISSHEAPIPYIYTGKGNDIHFKTSDGKDAHAWEIKANEQTNVYLFMIHEWWGLNDNIKREAEKYADELGINIIALDLYDNQVATNSDDAAKIMQSVKKERATAIIRGGFDYVGKKAKIFTIGWCFGGGWSLQTAIEAGNQAIGCIMFYGMPEENVSRLKALHCDVIGFFGKKDEWINEDVVKKFQDNMKEAGKNVEIHEYDAEHAFANPSNPHYDKEATADAYSKTIEFIKKRIK